MMRRGKLLFWAGVICVMGGLLFVGLFGFTLLRQGLQDRLVSESLEELGYRGVIIVERRGSSSNFIVASFDGREPTREELDEASLEAQRRAGKKLVHTLRLGSLIGAISGLVLMTTGYILQILPKRRTEEKTSRSRRRRALRAIPRSTSQTVPARGFPGTAPPTRLQESIAQTWKGVVADIQAMLPRVNDLSLKTVLGEALEVLYEEERERVPMVRHLLWRIEEALISQSERRPVESKKREEPADGGSSVEEVLSLQDLLLPIDTLVSGSGIDPGVIKAVLIAFLRPGNERPLFGANGASQEVIRRWVKLSSKDTDEGLRYLLRIGLLRQGGHKNSERGLSLDLSAKGHPAKEIAQLMLQARRTIEQKGVLIH